MRFVLCYNHKYSTHFKVRFQGIYIHIYIAFNLLYSEFILDFADYIVLWLTRVRLWIKYARHDDIFGKVLVSADQASHIRLLKLTLLLLYFSRVSGKCACGHPISPPFPGNELQRLQPRL